jgi:hypothetical protein
VWAAYAGWQLNSDYTMPSEGYVAMWIGIALSLIVGCGLMVLVFYSSRKGYDEPPKVGGDGRHRIG